MLFLPGAKPTAAPVALAEERAGQSLHITTVIRI